jgi:SAM-dependent methyltransferase
MASYRDVTACRLCDSEQLVQALDLGHTPLANELDGTELFPLVVNRCESCGHHQLSIAVSASRLWGPSYPYQSGTSPVFRKHLEALANEVAALKPGGCVLEIASNDGTLVDALQARGLFAVGYDPSGPDDPERHLQQVSWPLRWFAPDLPKLDVILALNVFAHVDDLHSFTAAVKEALAPDGVFIVEVGYLPEQIERGQFDTIYHEHLSYHHVAPLMDFFDRHGLRAVRCHRVESQGGSVRLYVKHADGQKSLLFFEDEPDVEGLSSGAWGTAKKLDGFFQANQGKLICGYGAPAKLTTFLYATSMHENEFFKLACIGEDNPLKVGRTTPGMHIPIVSVADMLAREPDCIIVFAWNFFDDIRDKLRRLGFAGDIINPMQGGA